MLIHQEQKLRRNFSESHFKAMDFFEDGLRQDRLKKYITRKDAVVIYSLEEKYRDIQKRIPLPPKINKHPLYILRNGKNIFNENDLTLREISQISEIYELNFNEKENIKFEILSKLPNLNKLKITFSSINFKKHENSSVFLFRSLQYLDLSFCNLSNEILVHLENTPCIVSLNLSGNQLDGTNSESLPKLRALKELDLSANNLVTIYVNLDKVNTDNFNQIDSNTNYLTNDERENIAKNQNDLKLLENNSNVSKNTVNDVNQIQYNSSYKYWHKVLETNLQNLFLNIGRLPLLQKLNLSNNKIHYFDVNPFNIINNNEEESQNKEKLFNNLNEINLSNNIIEEEIGILMIVNLPKLQTLDLTGNPITVNKKALANVEYELFKVKEINLINNEIKDPLAKKMKKDKADLIKEASLTSGYKVKKYKVTPYASIDKKLKRKINEMLEYELNYDDNESITKINYLKNNNINQIRDENIDYENYFTGDDIEESSMVPKQNKFSLAELMKTETLSNENGENLFLTKTKTNIKSKSRQVLSENNKDLTERITFNYERKLEKFDFSCEYDKFLKLAKKCFGNSKAYTKVIPIQNAYQRLRFLLNNLPTNQNTKDDLDNKNYMLPTKSRISHLSAIAENKTGDGGFFSSQLRSRDSSIVKETEKSIKITNSYGYPKTSPTKN